MSKNKKNSQRSAKHRVHLPFSLLLGLLHQEARFVSILIQLVSDDKLSPIQRRNYCCLLKSTIFEHWEDCISIEISVRGLLKLCRDINDLTT